MLRPALTFFFFNDTATTEIYTLSLHDALPIWTQDCEALPLLPHLPRHRGPQRGDHRRRERLRAQGGNDDELRRAGDHRLAGVQDRKSTRLNSSHSQISYAVFCLKKKKIKYCHAWESANDSNRYDACEVVGHALLMDIERGAVFGVRSLPARRSADVDNHLPADRL